MNTRQKASAIKKFRSLCSGEMHRTRNKLLRAMSFKKLNDKDKNEKLVSEQLT